MKYFEMEGNPIMDDMPLRNYKSTQNSKGSRLKEETVIAICQAHMQGIKPRIILKQFNLTEQTIYNIIMARTHKHITVELLGNKKHIAKKEKLKNVTA